MHVMERFRRVDADTLEMEMETERTPTNPIALAKPLTTTVSFDVESDQGIR